MKKASAARQQDGRVSGALQPPRASSFCGGALSESEFEYGFVLGWYRTDQWAVLLRSSCGARKVYKHTHLFSLFLVPPLPGRDCPAFKM